MIRVITTAKSSLLRHVLQSTIEATGIGSSFSFLSPEDFDPQSTTEPSVVLALGDSGLSFLKQQGLVPKNRTVNSMQGMVFQSGGHQFLVSFDPGAIYADWSKRPLLLWAVQLAARIERTGSELPEIGQYEYVEDFANAIAWITQRSKQTGKPVPAAIDLETMGLDPYRKDVRILTFQLTYRKGTAEVLDCGSSGMPSEEVLQQIVWLLNSEKITLRGANLKFDLNWIAQKWGITCTRFTFDTTLVGSLLDENRTNSLNLHTKIYAPELGGYDDPFNAQYNKSKMEEVPKKDLLIYAGGDSDATYRVADQQKKALLKRPRLANFYVRLQHPAMRVFEKMERRGIYVDAERYDSLEQEVAEDEVKHLWHAYRMIPRGLRIKHSDGPTLKASLLVDFLFGPRGLNLKPKMLTPKAKEPATSMEHLEMFADHPKAGEFLAELKAYKAAQKTLSTYIVGFRKHIREDGMFHPSYILHRGAIEGGNKDSGTVTGRTSAKDPPFQTIPKHTKWSQKLREVYVPPPGYCILVVDFSQGELRIGACVANEENMIAAYREGIDVHLITGCMVNQIPLERALSMKQSADPEVQAEIATIRQGGKAGNFGLIYGMQVPGFQNYARTEYGIIMTLEECEAFRNGFFEQWPGFLTYHKTAKEVAKAHKAITSPLGRTRHLPLIDSKYQDIRSKQERQAINSPIQSSLSDLTQLAMVEIDRQYPDLHIFGMTHDSISMYVPTDEYQWWAKEITEIMENLPLREFNWHPPLAFPADAEVGFENMGHLTKLAL